MDVRASNLQTPASFRTPAGRRRSRIAVAQLTLWFITIIATASGLQHLHAQQVTSEEPPTPTQASANPNHQQTDLPDLDTIARATPFPQPRDTNRAVLESDTQSKHGDLYLLSGNVDITYRDHVIHADKITYNDDTGDVSAEGHVRLTGGENDESIAATRGTYNLRTGTGRFFEVKGSVGLHIMPAPGSATPNPFIFQGRVVVKTGPQNYDVYDGSVTACLLPNPDWLLSSRHMSLNQDKAHAANSVFRLLNVPVLFLPYVTHPIDANERQSGLLIPVISQSSTKGFVIGEEVYLVLGRSADLTAGFEYFSSRGFSQSGTFRYRGPGADFLTMHFAALQDRGYFDSTNTYINQGGQDVTAAFRNDFTSKTRAVADGEYLSSYVYREAFNNNFNQAVSSDITSIGYIARQSNGFAFDGRAERYQGLKRVPVGTTPGVEIHILHVPSFDFTGLDHHIGSSPLLWDVTSSLAGLKRAQGNYTSSGIIKRLDVRPELALPLSGGGWHALSSIAFRETFYSHSRQAPYGNGAVPIELTTPVSRTSVETKIVVRPPAIERTFVVPVNLQKYFGLEVRHTVEPELTYRNTSGIGNFLSILRFDDDDLDANTNEIEYGVTQHLYFKPKPVQRLLKPGCLTAALPAEDLPDAPQPTSSESATDANGIPTVSVTVPTRHVRHDPCAAPKTEAPQREWFSWTLAQRHFFDSTFGNAVVLHRRNIFETTLSLSGIAFLTEPRDISPIVSRMRFRTSSHTDIGWDFDLDVTAQKFTSSNIFLDTHEGQLFGGFSFARLNAPGRFNTQVTTTTTSSSLVSSATSDFSQMRVLLGYGTPTRPGLSAAANAGIDLDIGSLQYASVQTSYNWNCCGLSVEYRKYELGSVRNEGVERFSFTLINIGSAGNLRRTERLF